MNFKIISIFAIAIFLISCVSAMTVYSEFSDGSPLMVVTEGDSITFNADFVSMNPPISSMRINLYSEGSVIYSFLDSSTNQKTFSESYTYNADNEGTYTIRIIGKDSSGSIDSRELTLIVKSVDEDTDTIKPVITILGNNPSTIYVGNTYSDAGATASDNVVDESLTLRIQTINTINVNVIRTYYVTYTVSDNAGNTATATRTVNVIANPNGNSIPEIESISNQNTWENEDYSYKVKASDEDDLEYELDGPSWLSISSSGLIYGTAPSVSSDKEYYIVITVSDGEDTDSETYTLTVENDDYSTFRIDSISNKKVNENKRYSYQIETNYQGDEDDLEYELDGPSWLSISSSGLIYGTASSVSSDKEYKVTIKVSNGEHTDSEVYTLTIEDLVSKNNYATGNTTTSTSKKNKSDNSLYILFYTLLTTVTMGIILTSYCLIKTYKKKKLN